MSDDLRAILESVNGLHGKIDTHSRDTHKRIDDLGEKVSGLAIQVTRVEGEVQSYNRPCAVDTWRITKRSSGSRSQTSPRLS